MAEPLAGETVRASHYPKVRVVVKAADESLASNVTPQNDDELTVALDANKTYRVELHAVVDGGTTGDVRLAWATTGGVAKLAGRNVRGPESATAGIASTLMRSSGRHALSTNLIYGIDGTNFSFITEEMLVETTTVGTPGTLTLQWAQGTVSVTATVMKSQSYLVVTEVDPL